MLETTNRSSNFNARGGEAAYGKPQTGRGGRAGALPECVGGVRPVSKLFKLKRVEYDDQTGKKVREYEEIVTGTEEVYDTPSTTAQQFWLKNRLPRQWGGGEDLAPDGLATGVVELRRQRTAPKAAARPVDKIGHSGIDRLFCRILNKIIHTEKKSSINIQSIMDGK